MSKPTLRDTLPGKIRTIERKANAPQGDGRLITCHVRNSTDINVPLIDPFEWDTVVVDTDNMFDPATPNQINIRTSGYYMVIANAAYKLNTFSGLSISAVDVRIRLPEMNMVAVSSPTDLNNHNECQCTWMGELIAGDFLEATQWNDDLVTVTALSDEVATWFKATRIGLSPT